MLSFVIRFTVVFEGTNKSAEFEFFSEFKLNEINLEFISTIPILAQFESAKLSIQSTLGGIEKLLNEVL